MDALRVITSLVGLAIFVFLVIDVWRSRASTGAKVGWTIAALLCNLVTLIVWLVWGRKNAGAPSASAGY